MADSCFTKSNPFSNQIFHVSSVLYFFYWNAGFFYWMPAFAGMTTSLLPVIPLHFVMPAQAGIQIQLKLIPYLLQVYPNILVKFFPLKDVIS